MFVNGVLVFTIHLDFLMLTAYYPFNPILPPLKCLLFWRYFVSLNSINFWLTILLFDNMIVPLELYFWLLFFKFIFSFQNQWLLVTMAVSVSTKLHPSSPQATSWLPPPRLSLTVSLCLASSSMNLRLRTWLDRDTGMC